MRYLNLNSGRLITSLCVTVAIPFGSPLFGQDSKRDIRWGPFFEYAMDIKPVASSLVADKFSITAGQSLDGFRTGIFGQMNDDRGFWKSELGYFKGTSFLNYVNLNPGEDMAMYGFAELEASSGSSHRIIELSILRGMRVVKELSLVGGITGGHQFKEDLDGWSPDPTRPIQGAQYSLSNNYNQFIALATIGINYQFGPLAIYLQWKNSLTSVTKGVDYEGVLYPVNYQLRIWSLGVNFYPLYRDK